MKSLAPLLRKALDKTRRLSIMLVKTDYAALASLIEKFYIEVESSKGTVYAIKEVKGLYGEASRYSLDTKVDNQLTQGWYKRDEYGFMTRFQQIRLSLDNASINQKRMILSLLRCYEVLKVTPSKNIDSITKPSSGNKGYLSFKQDYVNFLNTHDFPKSIKKDFTNQIIAYKEDPSGFHYTTRKGIEGNTLGTAGIQSLAIGLDLKESLIKISNIFSDGFERIINYNQDFYKRKLIDINGTEYKPDSDLMKYQVKIASISDKGGKTRNIAIGNYWVQQALKPLHNTLFEVLRHVSTDGTHNQESQWTRVMAASLIGPVWSFDLTAATDRFPKLIQTTNLKYLYLTVGVTWSKILEQVKVCHESKEVVYEVGQPMGLYSSWATFTLSHHLIVQYCSYLEGNLEYFTKYAILGDDIAIWDKAVAKRYVSIMGLLQVEINYSKSYLPSHLGPGSAEFAKRICKEGIEYSGVSPGLIVETKSIWEIPEMINFLVAHGFTLVLVPLTLANIMQFLENKSSKDYDMLGWALYINHLLGGLPGAVTKVSEGYLNITLETLFRIRFKLLVKDQETLFNDLFGLKGSHLGELAKFFDEKPYSDLVIIKVYFNLIAGQIILANELRRKFQLKLKFINGKFDIGEPIGPNDLITFEDINAPEGSSSVYLKGLKSIEYQPVLSLPDVIKGKSLHENDRKLKGRYIKRIVKLAKALSSQGQNGTNM